MYVATRCESVLHSSTVAYKFSVEDTIPDSLLLQSQDDPSASSSLMPQQIFPGSWSDLGDGLSYFSQPYLSQLGSFPDLGDNPITSSFHPNPSNISTHSVPLATFNPTPPPILLSKPLSLGGCRETWMVRLTSNR